MKKYTRTPTIILTVATAALWTASAYAGSLTPPPGPPVGTMKPLSSVEPRIPVQDLSSNGSALYVIDQPGSYYLIDNIVGVAGKHGIEIAAEGVTLDLNGFSMIGLPGALSAITSNLPPGPLTGWNGCVIMNGTVINWGGIAAVQVPYLGFGSMHRLRVLDNTSVGINGGNSFVVTECTALRNGGDGINVGVGSTVTRCVTARNGGAGIWVGDGSVVRGCTSRTNTGNGITAVSGCTVENCSAFDNTGDGIDAAQSLIRGNTSGANTGTAIDGGGTSTLVDNHTY